MWNGGWEVHRGSMDKWEELQRKDRRKNIGILKVSPVTGELVVLAHPLGKVERHLKEGLGGEEGGIH